MATNFLATLANGHEIRSASASVLKRKLADSGRITGSYAGATTPELREWAAALVWLADADTDISRPTLTALQPAQRATLCRMFKVNATSNVATTVNNLLVALGAALEVADGQQPAGGSFLDLLKTALPEDYREVAAATLAQCKDILAQSPFGPAATGQSALSKSREACAMLRWCHSFLHTTDDFAVMNADHLGSLAVQLRVQDVQADFQSASALAIIDRWRASIPARPADPVPADPRPGVGGGGAGDSDVIMLNSPPGAGNRTDENLLRRMRAATLSSPAPPAARFGAASATPAWWVHRLDFNGDAYSGVQQYAEHNILAPNCLGPSHTPGASVWEDMRGAGPNALYDIARAHGGAYTAELTQSINLLSSLHMDANQLISADERTQLHAARKAEDAKRRHATASLASWPWLQDLRVSRARTSDSYDLGRMLSVALRVDTDEFVSPVDQLARGARMEERRRIAGVFREGAAQGNLAMILLAFEDVHRLASRELEAAFMAAHALMDKFPKCELIVELAAGRDCQRHRIDTFMGDIAKTIKLGIEKHDAGARDQYMAGAYLRFFEGFNSSLVVSSDVDKRYLAAGSGFAASTGSSMGGSGGAGGAGNLGGAGASPGGSSRGGGTPGGGGGGSAQRGAANNGGAGRGTPPKAKGPGAQQKQQQQAQQQQGGPTCAFGVHIPCSQAIVGDELGIDGPPSHYTCYTCKERAVHYKGECPVAWGNHGTPLPGHNKDGARVPSDWNSDTPKKATYKRWVKFLKNSSNYPAGQAVASNATGAPDMAAFEDRAANARA